MSPCPPRRPSASTLPGWRACAARTASGPCPRPGRWRCPGRRRARRARRARRPALAGRSFLWVGGIGGASAAVLMSLAATPEAVVLLIAVQFAVALLLSSLIVAVHATGTQVAAATVVAMLSLLGLAKMAAALVTVWSHRQHSHGNSMANVATDMLIRSRRLLTVLV